MSAKWTFWAWEQQIKTAPKKLALLQLANNANDDGKSWYSIGKMATACGVGERTFQRQIQSLETDGLLHVERRSNRPSVYTLNDEVEITLHEEGCQSDGAGCQSDVSRGVTESPDLNNEPNTLPNNYMDSVENAFEVFWSAGMRKANKAGALKSFKKQVKDLKIPIPSVFAVTLKRDVIARIESKQFGFDKMHPTTYLNQQRWNDEYETNKPANAQTGRKLSPVERQQQRIAKLYGQSGGELGMAQDDGNLRGSVESGEWGGAIIDMDTGTS